MTRYFVDLSAYLGEEVYVELIDDANAAGWAVAFFDEINFYHETTPDVENGFDTVLESNETGKKFKSTGNMQIMLISLMVALKLVT